MPKELIYGDRPFGEEDPRQSVVDVRWDGESGYFQMATRERDAEVPPLLTITPETVGVEHTAAAIPVEYGWYVQLDRRGINELIRVLRRARDQAFGRDE
jgi:hypothetical protein